MQSGTTKSLLQRSGTRPLLLHLVLINWNYEKDHTMQGACLSYP